MIHLLVNSERQIFTYIQYLYHLLAQYCSVWSLYLLPFKQHRLYIKYIVTCRDAWLLDGVWIGFIGTLYTHLGTTGSYIAIADLRTLQFTVTHTLGFSVFTGRFLVTDFKTGTVTVSLNHTLQISLYCSTHKDFSSLSDFQLSTELARFLPHLRTANSGLSIQFSAATANYLVAISCQTSSIADPRALYSLWAAPKENTIS
jgi:hypothetical protein